MVSNRLKINRPHVRFARRGETRRMVGKGGFPSPVTSLLGCPDRLSVANSLNKKERYRLHDHEAKKKFRNIKLSTTVKYSHRLAMVVWPLACPHARRCFSSEDRPLITTRFSRSTSVLASPFQLLLIIGFTANPKQITRKTNQNRNRNLRTGRQFSSIFFRICLEFRFSVFGFSDQSR